MAKQKYIKDKNFLLLFFGNLVSGVGSKIHGFGIALFILELTGEAFALSKYIALWTIVIFIACPIAATYTDRWKKKVKVLYVTDFGRGILYLLCALGVYYFMSINNVGMTMVTIYTLLVFIAIQAAFFAPAVTAIIPQIVEGEELVSASSIMQITNSIQNIAGMFLGAILYYNFGIVILMVINAASFIFSAISEMFIKYDIPKNQHLLEQETLTEEKFSNNKIIHEVKRIYHDLKDAIIYVIKDEKPILMVTLIMLVGSTLSGPWFAIGVPYMIKQYFTFASIAPEYLLASSEFVESIGVILMSLVVASIASRFKIYQLFRFGGTAFAVMGVLYFIMVYSFDQAAITEIAFIVSFIGIGFLAGMINALINAPLQAAMQKYINPNKIGKVMVLVDTFGGILFPITALLAGYLIDFHSIYYPIFMLISAMFIIVIIAFSSKELKKLK